ncbi:2OG-Fe-II oxygenase [Mycena galopus ATCC 62051]|nr:2OG-Fe-II oxygenase [Mycena galopus ATCC 62051]
MSLDAQPQAFKAIPVIDLSNALNAEPAVRRALANEIKHACMEVGFFYVKNHGIPDEVMQRTLAQMTRFFDLPLEQKLEVENKKNSNFMGYSPVLSGNNDPNGAGDLQEGFEFKFEPDLDDGSRADIDTATSTSKEGLMAGANAWPAQLPEFRQAALEYYHRALNLGRLLLPLFALALDLPEDFFADKTKHSAAIMRLLHYPPQFGEIDDRVIGIGAHTDWECFTILWQQPGIQALQVLNASKEWIDAPAVEGTLVINLGDEFARWTNDVFTSTVHRAINRSGVRRYSIPLFFGTDYDVLLEPIPSCVSAERPARYEVITAGEYIKSRLQATYGHY